MIIDKQSIFIDCLYYIIDNNINQYYLKEVNNNNNVILEERKTKEIIITTLDKIELNMSNFNINKAINLYLNKEK